MAGQLQQVDSLSIEILVDNHIEWMTKVPPEFKLEVPTQLSRSPPIDNKLTGLPIVDLENYCCGAHGLSLLLTTSLGASKHRILFDAGPDTKSISRNLAALKINSNEIEGIVLSHWHADHSGGILTVLKSIDTNKSVFVDLNPDRPIARGIAPPPHFIPVARLPEDPSFEEIEDAGGSIKLESSPHTICSDHFFVSGEIERTTRWELGLIGGIQWVDGEWKREPGQLVMDERYIAVDVRNLGLVIFSSCSHAGIVNVLASARKSFPDRPLHMIIGGLHLAGPELQDRIAPTIQSIKEHSPARIVPLHCTGFNAKVALRNAFGDAVVPAGVGTVITLSSDQGATNTSSK